MKEKMELLLMSLKLEIEKIHSSDVTSDEQTLITVGKSIAYLEITEMLRKLLK